MSIVPEHDTASLPPARSSRRRSERWDGLIDWLSEWSADSGGSGVVDAGTEPTARHRSSSNAPDDGSSPAPATSPSVVRDGSVCLPTGVVLVDEPGHPSAARHRDLDPSADRRDGRLGRPRQPLGRRRPAARRSVATVPVQTGPQPVAGSMTEHHRPGRCRVRIGPNRNTAISAELIDGAVRRLASLATGAEDERRVQRGGVCPHGRARLPRHPRVRSGRRRGVGQRRRSVGRSSRPTRVRTVV